MKSIPYDKIDFFMEWQCPYTSCMYINQEYGDFFENEDKLVLVCQKCEKEIRVKEPDL
jgi:hypothetical protein